MALNINVMLKWSECKKKKIQLITIAESSWNMIREQGRGKERDLKGE